MTMRKPTGSGKDGGSGKTYGQFAGGGRRGGPAGRGLTGRGSAHPSKTSAFPEGRGGIIPKKVAEKMLDERAEKDARRAEAPKKPSVSPVLRKLAERRKEADESGEGYRPSQRPGAPIETMRIAKALARAGLCSRRDAERWILDGRVVVNNKRISSPALDVGPRDRITVDGRPLPQAEPPRLWRFHKPKGLVTTHYDPEGRPTVFDMLPPDLPRVISIGRLDFNTEGLLLLTNDGELARHLELPATGWLRSYRVRAWGRVTQRDLDDLRDGLEVDGQRYGPIDAILHDSPEDASTSGQNIWMTIGLREGKNREVRNILGHIGLDVNRLIRVSYGPFQLSDLRPGEADHVKRRVLADQLGPEVAARFGLTDPEPETPIIRHPAGARRRPTARD